MLVWPWRERRLTFLAMLGTSALAFALGWASRPVARGPLRDIGPIDAADPAGAAAVSAVGACDPEPMKANANLVAQLMDLRREKVVADVRASETARKLAAATRARSLPAAIASDRDEWARMAASGRVRVRTPCDTWSSPRRFGVVSPSGRGVSVASARDEARRRAYAAGLGEEELEAMAHAYERAHARTWEQMRLACAEGPLFAEALAESGADTDADRVAICQTSLLPDDEATRSSLLRMASARATGRTSGGGAPAERVAFALAASAEVLFDEVSKMVGVERATRAADLGFLCTNETVYVAAEE